MRKRILILVSILISSIPLCANGGIHWGWNGSGTDPVVITLKNDADIILKKENLVLRFVDESVIVSCDYVLYNQQNEEKQFDFAFNITESSYDSLMYYYITVDGNKLPSDLHKEAFHEENESSYSWWELSKIKLAAKKETIVSICYRVETSNDGTYYRSFFDRDNSFVYNLYPALSFGDGIIEDFSLTIDASDILSWNGKISKIVTKQIKNLDLKKNRQIKISYNIKNYYFAKLYKMYGFRTNGISATSELKEGKVLYSASNLMDNDCRTAWVESKSDFGQKERIKIPCSGWITQLLIVNGFRKSEKTYYENNRVKRIALYVDGVKLGEMTFPDRPYCHVDMSNILDEGELLNFNGDFFKENNGKSMSNAGAFWPKENIEIEILEVYPGTKYNDTCISDIYLIKAVLPIP